MDNILKRNKLYLSKKDIQNLSCFFYNESNGFLATAFFNFPLALKRHCVQVGVIAGQMALHAPNAAVPAGMGRDGYANAVRYGCLYHDIGAYLVYNQRELYPAAGERFLREQLGEDTLNYTARQIILDLVQCCGERYDGQGYPDKLSGSQIPLHAGICAIADQVDSLISDRHRMFSAAMAEVKVFIQENSGVAFSPEAVECFTAAYAEITQLYKHWRKSPPFWNNRDARPLSKSIDESIG